MVAVKAEGGGWTRGYSEPTVDERGDEHHPAWAMIGASRGSNTPGAVLFDSDIRHGHSVRITISTASRRRDLNRDWLHAEKEIIEVEVSEAQWASFVSSMNVGSGVPCTIRRREDDILVDAMPYQPRLRESMDEVARTADEAYGAILEAFKVYDAKRTAGNLRDLRRTIEQATGKHTYAAKSLVEHTENVVQKARADVEAFVTAKARQLGIEPGDIGPVFELEGATVVDESEVDDQQWGAGPAAAIPPAQ